MTERRFFCDMSKLTIEERARLHDLRQRLASTHPAAAELPAGYALTFDGAPATYRLVAEWLGYERLCCGFVDMELTSTADGGPIRVSLTCDGRKEMIREEFDAFVGEER